MKKTLIGFTSYHRNAEDWFTILANYLEVIDRAGRIPVVIAPSAENADELIGRLDGLVLTGDGDIDPAEYDGEQKETVYGINRERDRYELKLVRLTLEAQLPTLTICRELQVLNVALDGTLIEHIPDEHREEVIHRGADLNKVEYSVSIDPESRLVSILGVLEIGCPSYQYQAIRNIVVPGFRMIAQSKDGVIEAIESDEYPRSNCSTVASRIHRAHRSLSATAFP